MDAERFADTPFGGVRGKGGRHGYLAYFPKPIPRQFPLAEDSLLRPYVFGTELRRAEVVHHDTMESGGCLHCQPGIVAGP